METLKQLYSNFRLGIPEDELCVTKIALSSSIIYILLENEI